MASKYKYYCNTVIANRHTDVTPLFIIPIVNTKVITQTTVQTWSMVTNMVDGHKHGRWSQT